MIDVGYIELHDTMNFGGKNFADKRLDNAKVEGLVMYYDEVRDELVATYNSVSVRIPKINAKFYIEGVSPSKKVANFSHPMVVGAVAQAQVETPFGHVHAGPGQGKKGK